MASTFDCKSVGKAEEGPQKRAYVMLVGRIAPPPSLTLAWMPHAYAPVHVSYSAVALAEGTATLVATMWKMPAWSRGDV